MILDFANFFHSPEIKELTQEDFKKIFLLSYERIEKNKEEINKINIFPVPDQDTGNNLAKTLEGIKKAIEKKEFKNLEEICKVALDGALTAAQGNAGVIYTGFLAGFLPLLDKNSVNGEKLAIAFKRGAEKARLSIQNPKQGTILDVIDAAVKEIEERVSQGEENIFNILKSAIEKANQALLNTPEKMAILKKANVVDAGGLGFLMILQSYLEAMAGKKIEKKIKRPSGKVKRFVQIISNRYEVVSLIKNPAFSQEQIQEKLKKMGNSLDVVQVGNKMKIHIHTDYPNEVKNIMRGLGQIQSLRTQDMAKEMAGEESVRKISIGIVTGEVVDLTKKITEHYQIEVVPFKVDWPEGENLPGENIYQKMREADKRGIKALPKTAGAVPKKHLEAFQKQLERFEKVLYIAISSKLSGAYNSACQMQELLNKEQQKRVFILDSLNAAAGQALLVLRAIELIQEQREIDEIIKELESLIPKTHLYIIFEDPKWIEAGGRITKSQANWIRIMKKFNLSPLMAIKKGIIAKAGIVWATDMAGALFKKISKESQKIRKKGGKIRVVIGHADNLTQAEKLKQKLKKIGVEVSYINSASPVICAHAGPGTLLVAWTEV